MMTRRSSSVLSCRSRIRYSFNIDWYFIFTRILDNDVLLLPICLLHISTPYLIHTPVGNSSTHKRGTPLHMQFRKRYKIKRSYHILRSWYDTLPILFSSYMVCVSLTLINTGTSTNVGTTTKRNVKIKFRRKCKNNKCLRKIITYNNQQKQQRLPLHDYRHQACLTTNHHYNNNNSKKPCPMIFDSDSVPIRVDNCCSRTLSGSLHDFDKSTLTPTTSDMTITGFGGTKTRITHTGTIIWRIHDDHGVTREIRIPHSFYIPTSKHRLLSPQHWA
jgi:hypothetical protein